MDDQKNNFFSLKIGYSLKAYSYFFLLFSLLAFNDFTQVRLFRSLGSDWVGELIPILFLVGAVVLFLNTIYIGGRFKRVANSFFGLALLLIAIGIGGVFQFGHGFAGGPRLSIFTNPIIIIFITFGSVFVGVLYRSIQWRRKKYLLVLPFVAAFIWSFFLFFIPQTTSINDCGKSKNPTHCVMSKVKEANSSSICGEIDEVGERDDCYWRSVRDGYDVSFTTCDKISNLRYSQEVLFMEYPKINCYYAVARKTRDRAKCSKLEKIAQDTQEACMSDDLFYKPSMSSCDSVKDEVFSSLTRVHECER